MRRRILAAAKEGRFDLVSEYIPAVERYDNDLRAISVICASYSTVSLYPEFIPVSVLYCADFIIVRTGDVFEFVKTRYPDAAQDVLERLYDVKFKHIIDYKYALADEIDLLCLILKNRM